MIIEGRDQITGPLSSAVASVRAEVQKLKGDMKGLDSQFVSTGRSAGIAGTGLSGTRREQEAFRKSSIDAAKASGLLKNEVTALTNTLTPADRALRQHTGTLGAFRNVHFSIVSAVKGTLRGLQDMQKGVRDLDANFRKAQGPIYGFFYKMAQGADQAWKSFTRLNTIAALLAPIIFTLLGAIVNLGAALVAVAAAAGQAAVALGGALVSGIGQLIPMAVVLVSVFQRLKLILQASTLETKQHAAASGGAASAAKTHREAVQRLADAMYALKQQYQSIKDDVIALKDAEKNLSDARRQATRDLVDSRYARTDAILAERDASLSLLEAKQNLLDVEKQQNQTAQDVKSLQAMVANAKAELAAAKATGDEAAIVAAEQRLGIAQQELGTVSASTPQQKLAVARARLTVDQASQRKKEAGTTTIRAIQDNNRAEREGIQMAPGVISARRAVEQATRTLANAYHDLAIRVREAHDAQYDLAHPTSTGGGSNLLKSIMAQLDPAEKNLLKVIDKFKKTFKLAMRPITDEVVNAIAAALPRIEKLFKDKKFMAGLKGIGDALAKGITQFSKFLTSPEQKHFFEQFSHLATKNLPIILHIFEQVIRLVERIGIAFAPILHNLLQRADSALGRRIKAGDKTNAAGQSARDTSALSSGKYLDSLISFVASFFHLIGAIVGIAKGPGKSALDQMTATFNKWSTALRTTKKGEGEAFFTKAIGAAGSVLNLLGKFIALLFRLTAGSGFTNFVKFLSGPGFKAFQEVGDIMSILFTGLAKISNWPVIGTVLQQLMAVFIAAKLVPGFGVGMRALVALVLAIGKGGFGAIAGGGGLMGSLKKLFSKRGESPANPLFVEDISNRYNSARGAAAAEKTAVKDAETLSKWAISAAGLKMAFQTVIRGGLGEAFGAIAAGGIAGMGAAVVAVLGGAAIGAWIGNTVAKYVPKWLQVFNPDNKNIGGKLGHSAVSIALTPIRGLVDTGKSIDDLIHGHWGKAFHDFVDIFTNPFKGWFGGGDNKKKNAIAENIKTGKVYEVNFGKSVDLDKTPPPRGFAWVDEHGKYTGYSKKHPPSVGLAPSLNDKQTEKAILNVGKAVDKTVAGVGKSIGAGLTGGFGKHVASFFDPGSFKVWSDKNIIGPIKKVLGIFSPAQKLIPLGQGMADGLTKGWADNISVFFDVAPITDWFRNHVLNPLNTWRDSTTAKGRFFWGIGDSMAMAVADGFGQAEPLLLKAIDALPKAMQAEVTKIHKQFAKVGNMITVAVVGGLAGLKHSVQTSVAGAASASAQTVASTTGMPGGPVAGSGPLRARAVGEALAEQGKPYVWGATGPNAFDCSGLVQWALGRVGISVPRTTYAQVATGRAVSLAGIAPGDAIFTNYGENGIPGPGHEGMYVGGGQVVEAPYPGQVVHTISLRDFIGSGSFAIRDFFPTKKTQKFDQGGEVKGALGRAVPVIAHVGEWILNEAQQRKLAQAIHKPIGLVKDFLFGPHPNPKSPVPMNESAKRYLKAKRLIKSTAGNRYFGPGTNDWQDALPNIPGADMLGREQRSNDPRFEPVFMDTPLHQWVSIGRKAAELLKEGHGFWIPEVAKRAPGFARATRSQIQDWKRSNILSGLTDVDPGFRSTMVNNILRSPLWSYAQGGEVGWNPAPITSGLPSFASGGVVTTPAVSPATQAGTHVEQSFAIKTASPHVDIDYIMRRAKVAAEGSF